MARNIINLNKSIKTINESCELIFKELDKIIKSEEKLSTSLSDDMIDYILDKAEELSQKFKTLRVNAGEKQDTFNKLIEELHELEKFTLNKKQFLKVI